MVELPQFYKKLCVNKQGLGLNCESLVYQNYMHVAPEHINLILKASVVLEFFCPNYKDQCGR